MFYFSSLLTFDGWVNLFHSFAAFFFTLDEKKGKEKEKWTDPARIE